MSSEFQCSDDEPLSLPKINTNNKLNNLSKSLEAFRIKLLSFYKKILAEDNDNILNEALLKNAIMFNENIKVVRINIKRNFKK